MRYTVTASVNRTELDGWASARQVPTFGLPDLGNSLPATAAIAWGVIDPYHTLTVHVAVWDNVANTGHTATFERTEQ